MTNFVPPRRPRYSNNGAFGVTVFVVVAIVVLIVLGFRGTTNVNQLAVKPPAPATVPAPARVETAALPVIPPVEAIPPRKIIFAIQGMHIGDLIEEGWAKKHIGYVQSLDDPNVKGVETIHAGNVEISVLYQFFQHKLANVTMLFDSRDYSTVIAVFTDKFGPPTSQVAVQLQTNGGIDLTGEVSTWETTDGRFVVKEHNSLTEGSGFIDTQLGREFLESQRQSSVKELKSKL